MHVGTRVHEALLVLHATRMRHIVTSFVPPPGSAIFRHYLINGAISGKKVTEHKMCVFIFSTTFVYKLFHSKENLTRYCQKRRNVFMQSTIYSCGILMKLKFSG